MSNRISASAFEFSTLIDLLRWRASNQPEQRLYTFLTDGDDSPPSFSFAELDRQARIVAAALQEQVQRGERALLIYPSGLEFIAAFFGCLYSGIIAVPVYPPSAVRSDRTLNKFRAIARDAQPLAVLTCTSLSSRVSGLLAQSPELQAAHVLVTDQLPGSLADQWAAPDVHGDSLAFFQYTSGSTGLPKGVMVSHANLLHNSSLIERYCQHPDTAHGVTWLPLYHDLGLIGGILQPLYAGYESTIMAPTTFLQRPLRWLQAISDTHATYSGAPNFAFDMCVRKIKPEQKAGLDLSSWEIVANGAEPVRVSTLERFAEAFAECGFHRANSYPCYGLAEATLVVSAGTKGIFPTVETFQGKALEHNQVVPSSPEEKDARTLVSIGRSLPDQQVLIVDPDTFVPCKENHVGEIWVAGPSVAQGYWQKPVETAQTFHAHLTSGEGPFLRTGDLGFKRADELFITGRLKDLIIIRGSNHYPQDIEQTVEQSHPALRPAACAVFSVEAAGEERLVVVQEVERQFLSQNLDEAIQAIREAVARQHELQVYAIALIKTGSIPKTSSGKIQHRGSREAFLDGTLDIVKSWQLDLAEAQQAEPADDAETILGESTVSANATTPETSPAAVSAATSAAMNRIQEWLIAHIAEALHVPVQDIDVQQPFVHYGMDSAQAVTLSADLEDWLHRSLPPTLVYDYPSIEALARFLANDSPDAGADEEYTTGLSVAEDEAAIAIVGLGCRFPGAQSADEFWQLLRNGVDAITEVPAQRWDQRRFYDPHQATPGKMNTRWGGFLPAIDQFDTTFFGIAPREASSMDPQQRLLLEVAWETLENAGIAPEKLSGSQTGVFVGISSNDYSHRFYKDPQLLNAYMGTGNSLSIAANRLSYFLDLRGPSMAMDTACSSSLLAVHQACQSILRGECEQALAGGVNLILSPELTITLSQARMLSSAGRCRTFDEEADGYVRGEGCGLVLLKPLSQALADGNQVLAVIRGSAVNQDGRSNGLTAPNGPSQEAVIRQALHNAHVTPDQISYVETHGSSTPLGDPIEVASLKAVLMPSRSDGQPCVLGSVKTNVGHLESAAGIAGLIKTVLCLQHGEIVPHLHLHKLNPHIPFADTTFTVATTLQPWPQVERRLAGVSAFGFGGTNVHVVLEAAPTLNTSRSSDYERPEHVLALSAQTATALKTQARQYAAFLEAHPAASLADICYSANTGRNHFAHRLAVSARTTKQLRAQLTAFANGEQQDSVVSGHVRSREQSKLAFLFPGQGSQYAGMARQLYSTQPAFQQALDRCDRILRAYLQKPLLSVLFPTNPRDGLLDETGYTQPVLFAFEYALAQLWLSWGVQPSVVMGHSVGEYVAACLAGMYSLEDGLKLIASRGRLMQALPQHGDMVVTFTTPEHVTRLLQPYQDKVAIAAFNGPRNTVLSGERQALQELMQQLEAEGIATHSMRVSHAFHSPLIEPMLDDFERVAGEVTFQPLRLPLVSNLTGELLAAGTLVDAHYWREQTRQAVQFARGMQTLATFGTTIYLEIGPDPVLTNMGKRCLPEAQALWLTSLRKNQDDWHTLLLDVAALYTNGVALDWSAFDRPYARSAVTLPTYPFERDYCWFEIPEDHQADGQEPAAAVQPARAPRSHPLLDAHVSLVQPVGMHVWEVALDKLRLPYLSDHRVEGAMALPVSAYVEMAQAASTEAFGPGKRFLTEIELKKLLLLPEAGSQKVQVLLSAAENDAVSFQVYSHAVGAPDQPHQQWTLHATGKIRDA